MKNIVLLGNPGVGKSMFCNILGADFETGVNAGEGLTKEVQKIKVMFKDQEVMVIDSPGLIETKIENNRRNAKEVTKALKQGGEYIVIFVIMLVNGRLRNEDCLMIAQVVKSINVEHKSIGLVMNMLNKGTVKMLKNDLGIILQMIKDSTGVTVSQVLPLSDIDIGNAIEYNTNAELFKAFVGQLPVTRIKAEDVKDVRVESDDAEAIKRDLEKAKEESKKPGYGNGFLDVLKEVAKFIGNPAGALIDLLGKATK